MKWLVRSCVLCACVLAPAVRAWGQQPAQAEPPAPEGATPTPTPTPAPTPPVTDPPKVDPAPESAPERIFHTRVYGYLNALLTDIAPLTADRPQTYDREAGQVIKEPVPTSFAVDAFLMVQGTIGDRYRYFLNVAALGAGDPIEATSIELRNAWVEASLYGELLAIRAGRMYRRFGLYNEILDASPTFMGIREPELLDSDHLMITRTTNLMLLGAYVKNVHKVSYSLATGSDERESNQIPLGADVSYSYEDTLHVGISYYDSMGKAKPGVKVGDGSPKGGVANWMLEDRYRVFNIYAQVVKGPWTAQLEYSIALHDAKRDPAPTMEISVPAANLSPAQYARFFRDPLDDMPPIETDVIQDVEYAAQAAYVRLGYELADGKLTPYVQGDYFQNPEVIPIREFGGDNEAGYDDRGRFLKAALGLMYRPISPVAFKVEYSSHFFMKWGGTSYLDPEFRASLSYLWEL